MTAVAGARPTFLTRTLLLSNPAHSAGKPLRVDITSAYSVFAVLKNHGANIRRSRDAYTISSKSIHSSSARASATAAGSAMAAGSAIPHISLHIAASSCGKQNKFRPEESTFDYTPPNPLGLQKGSSIQEKRKGRPQSGQDAYFVSHVGDSLSTAFAIADGVGGWTEHGIDPADFSHGLCSHMAHHAMTFSGSSSETLSPLQLLKAAYNATITDPDILAGGSTACVAVTNPEGRMRIANLGDSGFLHLRLGTVHHYSNPQTHAFNTPYQMSLTPPEILRQAKVFGGVPLDDKPERADLGDYMLQNGDVLVLATDGVWDNLDSQDVLKIVSRIMRESGAWTLVPTRGYVVSSSVAQLVDKTKAKEMKLQGSLQSVLAAAIVGEAKSAGLNKKRDGPFAKAVAKEYPYDPYHGGKPDDIAVLVVVPVENGGRREAKL